MLRASLVAVLGGLWAAPASATVPLPGGEGLPRVDFERHVMGLFGRAGCNTGSCHGSFQGRGGFRLSLFGHEPDKDFLAVARAALGRRINPANPDASLLLLKPTGQVPHGGGVRFGKGSWEYHLLRTWIGQGAPWDQGSGQVAEVTLSPPEIAFRKAGGQQPIQVRARFADGSQEDVTAFCDFRTNDDAVADVTATGLVRGLRPGSTAVIVSYRGNVRPVPVLVPVALPAGFAYPPAPERNYVDREVFARLRQLNVMASDLCGDGEFLRRVTIDTVGRLPSPAEVRAFAADQDPDKRAKKIDALLAHPLHAALWATRFCDLTGNDTRSLDRPYMLQPRASQAWHDWFRKRVHENVPYDAIVRGVLCATSREGQGPQVWMEQVRRIDEQFLWGHDSDYARRKTLDLYWRRRPAVTMEQWGERTAAAFLGVRLECAQCHKHPFDRWTQADYRAYANVFGAVAVGASPEAAELIAAENAQRRRRIDANKQFHEVREVFLAARPRALRHPDTGQPLPARAPGGPEIRFEEGKDMRETLFRWLRRPDNPYFARAFVNRIWGHYFGVGIVHPVDDFALANPPSNERLLQALAKDFVDSKFDIRHLERVILNSRVYQLSSKANATNRDDKVNFARSYLRPLTAEVAIDVLNSALGTEERWGLEVKRGARAIEVGASDLSPFPNPNVLYALRRFGRPPRTSACDCQRVSAPSLARQLFLMTDPGLLQKMHDPAGRLRRLLRSQLTDQEVFDELFLGSLSRLPTAAERRAFREYRRRVTDRRAAFADTLWALINTREFILNH
jgi:hypothetical protein